jgi:hypothetical protein
LKETVLVNKLYGPVTLARVIEGTIFLALTMTHAAENFFCVGLVSSG